MAVIMGICVPVNRELNEIAEEEAALRKFCYT